MSDLFAFIEKIRSYDLGSSIKNFINRIFIDANLLRSLSGIAMNLFVANRSIVNDDKIKMDLRSVALHDLEMFARGVPIGLAGLGHQIADEYSGSIRLAYCASHPRHQQG